MSYQKFHQLSQNRYFQIILVIILVFLPFFVYDIFSSKNLANYQTKNISFIDSDLKVYIADTQQLRQIGLSNITDLNQDEGMILLFDPDTKPKIVMRRMRFDLDLIWLSDHQIVYVEKYVSRDSKKVYVSPVVADEVLEVGAGWLEQHNIGIGAVYREE